MKKEKYYLRMFFFFFLFSFFLYGNKNNLNHLENKKIYLINEKLSSPIQIVGSNNIVIDCNNTKLIVTHPDISAFKIRASKNITIQNCMIDYDPIPHVAGTITQINKIERTAVFKPYKNYRESLNKNIDLYNEKRAVYPYPLQKPGIPKLRGTAVSFIDSIQAAVLGKYLINYKKIFPNFKVADTVVLVFRTKGASAIRVIGSSKVILQNITIYAAPSSSMVFAKSSNISVLNNKILLTKQRWLSTNADGVHIQSFRGKVRIENNIFDGLGDDCINIYTKALKLKQEKKAYRLLAGKYLSGIIHIGDTIGMFDRKTGIVSYNKIQKNFKKGKNFYLLFQKKVPKRKNIELYDIDLTNGGFTIRGNMMRNSRRYGILLKAQNGSIENNTFFNLGGSAMVMRNSNAHYKEGLNCKNISVSHNDFGWCGFGAWKADPVISIKKVSESRAPVFPKEKSFHEKIHIEKNIFKYGSVRIENLGNSKIMIDSTFKKK